jgi:hypothetical protein
MAISSIWPDIRLFEVSGIQPDTGYKKGRIVRPDILRTYI